MIQKIVKFKTKLKYSFEFECSDDSLQKFLEDGWKIKQINSHLPIKSTSGVRGMASESCDEIIIIALLEKED